MGKFIPDPEPQVQEFGQPLQLFSGRAGQGDGWQLAWRDHRSHQRWRNGYSLEAVRLGIV